MGAESPGKSRYWHCLLYEDSARSDWRNFLECIGANVIISPRHDKDVFDKPDEKRGINIGDPKKPHYHLMLIWDGPTTRKNAKRIVDEIGGLELFEPFSVTGMVQYFTHKNSPKKAQYSREDMTSIGAVDIDKYYMAESDKLFQLDGLLDFIKLKNVWSFRILLDWTKKYNRDWYMLIVYTHRETVKSYQRSLEYELRKGLKGYDLAEDGQLLDGEGCLHEFEEFVQQEIIREGVRS